MSDTPPPLPTSGLEPWDVALNDYLTWLTNQVTGLQTQIDNINIEAVAFTSSWQFNSNNAPPPGNGQMRANVGRTTLWVYKIDMDGYDRSIGLSGIISGQLLRIRATNGTSADWRVTGTPTNDGTVFTFPISEITGSVNAGSRTQIIAMTG